MSSNALKVLYAGDTVFCKHIFSYDVEKLYIIRDIEIEKKSNNIKYSYYSANLLLIEKKAKKQQPNYIFAIGLNHAIEFNDE